MRLKAICMGCARATSCSHNYIKNGKCAFRVGTREYHKWLGGHRAFEYDVCRQVHGNKHREPYRRAAV